MSIVIYDIFDTSALCPFIAIFVVLAVDSASFNLICPKRGLES